MKDEWSPAHLAAADQELAACSDIVTQLVDQWWLYQPHFDGLKMERLDRLINFMKSDIFPAVGWTVAHITIAVLVERLAAATK